MWQTFFFARGQNPSSIHLWQTFFFARGQNPSIHNPREVRQKNSAGPLLVQFGMSTHVYTLLRIFRKRPLPVPPRGQYLAHHRLRQRGSPEKHPLPPGVIGIGQEQPDQQNSTPSKFVLHSRTQAIRRLRFGVVLLEVQWARI